MLPLFFKNTNGKVTNSQLETTNESQEVSPFPAGDHKAQINRRAQRHSKQKTEKTHKRSTKEVPKSKFSPLPTSGVFLIALANDLEPVFLKELSEKSDFEKIADDKKHGELPSRQRVSAIIN